MASILEQNTAALQAILDAVNALPDGDGSSGSGSGTIKPVTPKAVNFYDYDGTCLYAYTVEEAQALTEMPPLPEREGLICQGWNWSLEDVKAHNRAVNVGATYTTDDGTTRIYITLNEGRTSPMLGVCPNGTVTVDWGDGTAPDTLTGTSVSTVQWTPTHEYAKPGNYVILLTVDGEMGFYGSTEGGSILNQTSTTDNRNKVYLNAVQRIEIGEHVTSISNNALRNCTSMTSITIPESANSIGTYAFYNCYSLLSITIPESVTAIGESAFYSCYSLVTIHLPETITKINMSLCRYCTSLKSITIPKSVNNIGNYAFSQCSSLVTITLPESLTTLGGLTFNECYGLTSMSIPEGVTTIQSNTFINCTGIRYYDFSLHNVVPSLYNSNAFSSIPSDCEIRVPAALYDEWIAATNWTKYASQIVAV